MEDLQNKEHPTEEMRIFNFSLFDLLKATDSSQLESLINLSEPQKEFFSQELKVRLTHTFLSFLEVYLTLC